MYTHAGLLEKALIVNFVFAYVCPCDAAGRDVEAPATPTTVGRPIWIYHSYERHVSVSLTKMMAVRV